jgi:lipoprotein-anchoring transpeptidase ErfK/SrfK
LLWRSAATIGAGDLDVNGRQRRGRKWWGTHLADYSPGTIVVKTNERRLYLISIDGHAVRYPVGVGKSASSGPARPVSTANIAIRPGRRPPR